MVGKDRTPKDPLPEEFETLEDLAEFWDTHDLADYAEYLTPVECEVVAHPTHEYVITLSDTLNTLLCQVQEHEGVSIGTLINLWVQERLRQYLAATS